MARDKSLQTNIDGSDLVNFPNKRIKNNTGAGDGTPVNEALYGDIHEFFAKLMRLYGISYSGLPDKEDTGYQLVEAARALANKNDFILNLTTSANVISVPLKLNLVTVGESFVCLAQFNKSTETQIKGSLDTTPILKNITFKGASFKNGEYVRLVVTSTGVDLIRLSDGNAFDVIALEYAFLKAASQAQENAGAISTVASTPLTNFTAFADRVIGVASANFLATQIRNGLLSKEDKIIIDNIGAGPEKNYGWFGPIDCDTKTVGYNAPVSGHITQAQVTTRTSEGEVWTVTFANAMSSTDYQAVISIESTGTIETDNDIHPPVWKKINNTQIQVYLEETTDSAQAIKCHINLIQR